ncbi:MAG: DUF1275 family protein [Caulobacteraceae bacterium]|nr:DUF1275 family protein [Caulobacter sp.]
MSEAASAGGASTPQRPAAGGGGNVALALALTFAAGATDAVAFLAFGGVFVSFMSGDTTRLGLALSQGAGAQAVLFASVVALFVTGAAAAHALGTAGGRWRTGAVLVLAGLLLLMAAAVGDRNWTAAALVLTAPSMGALSTASAHAQGVSVAPTYVTGTLMRLGTALADLALGRGARGAPLLAASWAAMLAGAIAGAAAYARHGLATLVAPAVLVLVLAALVIVATALRPSRSEP